MEEMQTGYLHNNTQQQKSKSNNTKLKFLDFQFFSFNLSLPATTEAEQSSAVY